jgi:folate-dependent phosphoribosylglycinamide formyltransferase PurN
MRLVFLAVDDEFAGRMQQYIYARHADWVVGSVISTCAIYKKSSLGAMAFVMQQSGVRYCAEMFRMKVIRRITRAGDTIRPSDFARKYGVETFYSGNINSEEGINRLKSWSPDLVISTNFSHYIGARVREVARVGTWNLHKSYLPHYRGMNPSFYSLLNGEKQSGATLHKIAKGFDTGDIIKQVRIPIALDESVYSLNLKTSDVGGRMMAEFLEQAELDSIVATEQPQGDWPSLTYPDREAVRVFLSKGLRF